MIKQLVEPVFKLSCDWCDADSPSSRFSAPEGWWTLPSFPTVRPGVHIHICPECAKKILATRTAARQLGSLD